MVTTAAEWSTNQGSILTANSCQILFGLESSNIYFQLKIFSEFFILHSIKKKCHQVLLQKQVASCYKQLLFRGFQTLQLLSPLQLLNMKCSDLTTAPLAISFKRLEMFWALFALRKRTIPYVLCGLESFTTYWTNNPFFCRIINNALHFDILTLFVEVPVCVFSVEMGGCV